MSGHPGGGMRGAGAPPASGPAGPDNPGLVAAMSNPGFYAGRVGSVELRETHISWVFLAGDRAYKLKKPLLLPFLDSSTVSRRRELCDLEVALNRRTAPDLYLGVRAVVPVDGGFALAGPEAAEAVDYVVEMRRYDEQTTLGARLTSGRIRRSDVAAVARRLAVFHARAQRVPASRTPALDVERRMAENYAELFSLVEPRAELERLLMLQRFTHAFAVAHATTFVTRAEAGSVRDVHGDLRAEHVVLRGRVQIADCVEFDRGLREIDVADDLAFLVMDLTAMGGERYGWMLVDEYRAAGGDPGGDWLISFYASYRALVRAKVALLRAAQYPPASHRRAHENAAARDLLALAETFAWRARLPLVLVVCGTPAVGKSTLAEALARVSGLPHLSSDVTRKRLAGIGPYQRGPGGLYTAEASALAYGELGRLAAAESSARGGAIVDATFRHRSDRDAFARGFGSAAPVVYVECRAPLGVIARRAAARDASGRHQSDATLAIALRERWTGDPLDEVPPAAHLALRSDLPLEMQMADLRALLDLRLPELLASARAGSVERVADAGPAAGAR